MTPERWQLVKTIVETALDRHAEARGDYLREACGDDHELRAEVDSLLACETADVLSRPAAQYVQFPDGEDSAMVGRRLGAYQIVREIGAGGMGAVYLAERVDEFRQRVAVKLIRPGLDSRLVAARFRHERQILAGLDHPHIARLLDGGSTEDGRPYFVMEYVDGAPIDDYCASHSLSIRERLELFQQVCAAVQYAHQNLVVHRDIKPGNILVTADGAPKLLDFGIAKLLRPQPDAETAGLTVAGMRLMTPHYASPEQVLGLPVTTATDVYSLGVVLYQLFTGSLPYAVSGRSASQIERAICEEDPVLPSASVPRRKRLPRDLDTILLKALEKDPQRRFGSAQQFSDDIGRHIAGVPVAARPHTLAYRAGKFLRRHRVGVASTALVIVSLVAGLIGTGWEARRAQRRFDDVRRLTNAFLFEFHDKIKNLPGATEARQLVVAKALEYLDSLQREAAGDTGLSLELAEGYVRLGDVQGNPYVSNLGDVPAALASYDKALRITESILRREPRHALALRARARAFQQRSDVLPLVGRDSDAVASVRQAVSGFRALSADAPGDITRTIDLASSLEALGDVLGNPGLSSLDDMAGAGECYREALQNWHRALDQEPGHPRARRALAVVTMKLGDIDKEQQRIDAARQRYSEALGTFRLADLENPENLRVAAALRRKLAFVTSYTDVPAAIREYRRSIEGYQHMVAIDPADARARMDLAVVLRELGLLQETLPAERAAATASFRAVLDLLKDLEASQPGEVRRAQMLAEMRLHLGALLVKAGRVEEGRALSVQGLTLAQKIASEEGAPPGRLVFYANALLTAEPPDLRDPAAALKYAQRASESAQGRDPAFLRVVAEAHYQSGHAQTAAECEVQVLRLLPPDSAGHAQSEQRLKRYRGGPAHTYTH